VRTLALVGYGLRLGVDNGMLVVTGRGVEGKKRFSPVDIDEIIVNGGVSLTSKALRLAAESGIPIYIICGRGELLSTLHPAYAVKTVESRRGQYKAHDTIEGLYITRCLVKSKILNQKNCIEKLYSLSNEKPREAIEYLNEKAGEAEKTPWMGGDWRRRLRHVEAEAARMYWSTLSLVLPGKLGFEGRNPDSQDPFNTSLNYLYAILYGRGFTSLVIAGLDPYAGVFHVDKSGRESLVYDFTDPLKPVIDYMLARSFMKGLEIRVEDGFLDQESKQELLKLNTSINKVRVKLGSGAAVFFEDSIRILAFKLSRYFRNPSSLDESFTLDWG